MSDKNALEDIIDAAKNGKPFYFADDGKKPVAVIIGYDEYQELKGLIDPRFEPWPDNLPLQEQVDRLGELLMKYYPETFDRSEGAMEKAARLLWELATSQKKQSV